MPDRETIVENTTPLTEPTIIPSENGGTPERSTVAQELVKELLPQPQIEKAITLVELNKDLVKLNQGLANLQRQVVAQMGAIQYVQHKIAELSKVEAKKEE